MPSFHTSYLVPAILLNPAFILHLFNTFISHISPPPYTTSVSPHPFMESLGPLPGTKIALDVHANEQLCWSYTAIMVLIQCLAFGRVQGNRVQRRSARAARAEREKLRKEKPSEEEVSGPALKIKMNGHATGLDGAGSDTERELELNAQKTRRPLSEITGQYSGTVPTLESEGSMTETSEEEIMA
ncbi:hypothetical protein BP5796_05118 [Coleophoma crateriformis]|uniref:Uncharacterized protein n=1 Tax=Coleophoma crateriformis TaxID=565419 RepID=A0A3D8S2N2_9HELO|nr:hypothetical protein BP5796_05118 [Coleophoma crateriformis]